MRGRAASSVPRNTIRRNRSKYKGRDRGIFAAFDGAVELLQQRCYLRLRRKLREIIPAVAWIYVPAPCVTGMACFVARTAKRVHLAIMNIKSADVKKSLGMMHSARFAGTIFAGICYM